MDQPIRFANMPPLEESWGYGRSTIDYIQHAAAHGLYEIRGLGAKRKLPHFDDLLFLAASLSRYPLEGYRERCETKTVLGTRYAKKPIELAIPITIAGMSFGALSANVKEALGMAATEMGTSTTTGDGGMTQEERQSSKTLVYQCLPSRYGFNPDDVRKADAIEIVIGQGAKPGGGGMLLGQKVNPRVARMRHLPEGIDQRSACRHPDWTGPDDLVIKIKELREITDWEKPIYVKIGATRTFNDVKLAAIAGADVVVVDGMQGGPRRRRRCSSRTSACRRWRRCARRWRRWRISTCSAWFSWWSRAASARGPTWPRRSRWARMRCRSGRGCSSRWAATAKPMCRMANIFRPWKTTRSSRTAPGHCHHCHTGRCPVGVTTQDAVLEQRLEPAVGARRVRNYLKTMNMELTTIARACGKQNVHHLEREDLVALTVEAAAMAGVPLAGTNWIPGS